MMHARGKTGHEPANRGRGRALHKIPWRCVGAIGVALLMLGAVGAGAQAPKGSGSAPDKSLLEPLDQLIRQIEREFLRKDSASPDLPAPKAGDCDTTENVVARFQKLEPTYTEIRQAIEHSAKQRVTILKDWRSAGLQCSEKFKDANKAALESAKNLQIDRNQQDLIKINKCVEFNRHQLEASLNRPGVLPQHIEKTAKDIDALRKLGNRILELTMDLGYFRDKRTRLVEEYAANLQGCP